LAGRPLRLDAGGEQTRSFCYIDDLVDGLVLMMGGTAIFGPANLGGIEEVTVRKLSQMVLAFVGSGSDVLTYPRRSDDPMQRRPSLDKVKLCLGWEAKVSLEEGLRKTLATFRPHLNH